MYKSDIYTRSSHIHIEVCHFMPLPREWNGFPMFANFWRLYYHTGEGASLREDSRITRLDNQHFYLIAPNTKATAVLSQPTGQLFMHFYVGEPLRSAAPGVYEINIDENTQRTANELIALDVLQKNQPPGVLKCTYLIAHALCQLPESAFHADEVDHRVKESIEYMSENIDAPVSIEAIAKQHDLTRATFIRIFKRATGETPYKYYSTLRSERAKLLLETSDLDIVEIAEQTGFVDRFHFSREFRKMTGLSPARYRQHQKGK